MAGGESTRTPPLTPLPTVRPGGLGSQLAAACFAVLLLPFGPAVWCGLWVLLVWRGHVVVRTAVIAYTVWFGVVDGRLSGERYSEWVRGWALWCALARYFPVEIVATTDLDDKGRYLFGYHPHGVLSLGAFVGLATDGARQGAAAHNKSLGGLRVHLCTLAFNFNIPFVRELITRLGMIPASRTAIRACLDRPGTAVAIVVGGAREALAAHRGAPYELILSYRKGFVREALRARAKLVPIFCFGEIELFETPGPGSTLGLLLGRGQRLGILYYGYSLPVFWGRLPGTKLPGAAPRPSALTLVVGSPIDPPDRAPGATESDHVNAYHAAYVRALRALFDRHAATYAHGRTLVIT